MSRAASGRRGALALGLWLALAVAVSALEVPFLAGRIVDQAGLLRAETEARLTEKLEAFESRTGNQVVVLTIPSLEGEVLEQYSLRVAETWGLGREGVDDGVLLLVAQRDRKMRIEVGYGLEHQLTDAQSGRILNNVLRPRFRSGDFDGGIEAGIDTILGTLEGADVIPPDSTSPAVANAVGGRLMFLLFFLPVVGLFSLQALFGQGCSGWFLYLFLIPFWSAFPMAFLGPKAGMVFLVAWVVGFPILKLLIDRTAFGRAWKRRHPGLTTWTTGRSGGGWSGGGFSGGGFSGGGGSFGGGGASGSW